MAMSHSLQIFVTSYMFYVAVILGTIINKSVCRISTTTLLESITLIYVVGYVAS